MAGKQGQKPKQVKYGTYRTPKGIAGFTYLREPDTNFGKNRQRIELFLGAKADVLANPEAVAFLKVLKETKQKFLASIGKKDDGKLPGLKIVDAYHAQRFGEYGVKEGDWMMEFSTNARPNDNGEGFKFVPIYDAANKPADAIRVFGGDIVRVSTTLSGYNTPTGFGIKCYLNAVQVLVKKNAAGAINPFSDESTEFDVTNSEQDAGDEQAPFDADELGDPSETQEQDSMAPTVAAGAATQSAAVKQTAPKVAPKGGKKTTVKPAVPATEVAAEMAAQESGEVSLDDLV